MKQISLISYVMTISAVAHKASHEVMPTPAKSHVTYTIAELLLSPGSVETVSISKGKTKSGTSEYYY